jgi:hypothetical protein
MFNSGGVECVTRHSRLSTVTQAVDHDRADSGASFLGITGDSDVAGRPLAR